ncbi:TetR/AcrR family transcriptional regulator [Aeromonas sp. S13(2024)]|uniref:TetR/AcrR family transcriptional regulator n=1 Tax=Aeromonas TaxID=642 RepID=UPI002B45C29D|nr:TetR/AcrR family transcriptional regulator [Aeromonas veronii]HDN9023626.1 TetR/AcrR family transcriptional regulator [Aeromonas veronii]
MARPASFDREQVLEVALNSFWETGFSNTGIATLVDRMGLKPSSLYGAFSSKEGLFIEVLQLYSAQSLAQIELLLASADSPLAGVRALLDAVARDAIASEAHRGCLLVNTLLEVGRQNRTIQHEASVHLAEVEQRVANNLRQAQAAGELAAERDIDTLAALLMTMVWGMRVLGRTHPPAAKVQAVLAQIQAML